jgi:septal ring-binding cell division protein DamX
MINILVLIAIATGLAYMVAYLSIIELMNTASKELEVKLNV